MKMLTRNRLIKTKEPWSKACRCSVFIVDFEQVFSHWIQYCSCNKLNYLSSTNYSFRKDLSIFFIWAILSQLSLLMKWQCENEVRMFRLMINQILKEAATGGALHKIHKKNTCVKVSFLIKLQYRGLQLWKKEPATHVFLWILWNFY